MILFSKRRRSVQIREKTFTMQGINQIHNKMNVTASAGVVPSQLSTQTLSVSQASTASLRSASHPVGPPQGTSSPHIPHQSTSHPGASPQITSRPGETPSAYLLDRYTPSECLLSKFNFSEYLWHSGNPCVSSTPDENFPSKQPSFKYHISALQQTSCNTFQLNSRVQVPYLHFSRHPETPPN